MSSTILGNSNQQPSMNFEHFRKVFLGLANATNADLPSTRGFTDDIVNAITNYGCWCGRTAELGQAYGGNPVDELDSLCRGWHQCRRCQDFVTCDGEVNSE